MSNRQGAAIGWLWLASGLCGFAGIGLADEPSRSGREAVPAVVRPVFTDAMRAERSRLIVLADMGNEPDEVQQILHLLLCAHELEIEGLLAVTGKHLRPQDSRPYRRTLHPELLEELVAGYEQVLPNLELHAAGWPSAADLRAVIACGQTDYGIADVGLDKSTPGSRLILAAAERDDARPLHVVINAGANTLAQALFDYRAAHTPAETATLVSRLRVFDNQAQDNAGAWICHEFPDIHWVRSRHQTRAYGGPTNDQLGPHVWQPYPYTAAGQDAWAHEHIRTNHGPLGAMYPSRQVFGPEYHFIEGGGTIPWMQHVCVGLSDPGEQTWGGWSGRYSRHKQSEPFSPYRDVAKEEQSAVPFAAYVDALGADETWTDERTGETSADPCGPVFRFRAAMWHDFQARMDWCVAPFAAANHHPRAALNGDQTRAILRLTARPGEQLTFDASASTDPDGDARQFRWWIDPFAGRTPYGQPFPLADATAAAIKLSVPASAAGKELHLILEVSDGRQVAPLVAYRRAVMTVTQ